MMDCNDSGMLQVIYIVKTFISIITVMAPVILIVMASIDIIKIIVSSMEKTSEIMRKIVKRFIAAILIFFIPSLVNILTSLLGLGNVEASSCWTNANTEYINNLKAQEQTIADQKAEANKNANNATQSQIAAKALNDRLHINWSTSNTLEIGAVGTAAGIPANEKLKYLFPGGVPTTESAMLPYLVDIQVDIIDEMGLPKTRTLKVHKALAGEFQAIFREIKSSGFRIDNSLYAYSWRGMAGNSSSRSHHSYGVAVDFNVAANPFIVNGRTLAGVAWRPCSGAGAVSPCNQLSITMDGPVVKAFERQGFVWGGKWFSSKDYMHFSYTGN